MATRQANLPLASLFVSSLNTRRDLTAGQEASGIDDLASSIRDKGLLQPITGGERWKRREFECPFRFVPRWPALMLMAGLVMVSAALAFTVTQSYDPNTRIYTYTVTVEDGDDPLRDFHLMPVAGGQKMKWNGLSGPFPVGAGGAEGPERNKWHKTKGKNGQEGSQGTGRVVSWWTDDADVGGNGDTEPLDDPIARGTANFRITAGRHKQRDVYWRCTTDGQEEPPEPPGGGPIPGPVSGTDATPTDSTPAPRSTTTVVIDSTEANSEWEIYLANSLSTPGDPATDPLGIGINTNDPVPPQYGISVMPSNGIFGGPPEPELPTAQLQLQVGPAPIGYRFYLVCAGKDKSGAIWIWSDPVMFTVDND